MDLQTKANNVNNPSQSELFTTQKTFNSNYDLQSQTAYSEKGEQPSSSFQAFIHNYAKPFFLGNLD